MVFDLILNVINEIAAAIIIVFVGFIIAKLAGKIAKRVMAEAELNRILKTAGFSPLSDTIGKMIEYIIYILTILAALQSLGLTEIVSAILILAAIAILSFILILTIKEFIPNAIMGIILRKKIKQYLGKKVQIGEIEGKLERIGIVSIIIKNGDEHSLPHTYTARQKITQLQAN